jgi:hypothetical protein
MYMRFKERLACTIKEAMGATGLGHTKIYELIGDGRLDTIKVDSRRLVRVSSLLRLLSEDGDPGGSDLPDGERWHGRRVEQSKELLKGIGTKRAVQPDA